MSQLQGKVALVTGGSRGLGAAIALRLAREGAAVALTFTSKPDKAQEVVEAIHKEGGRALAIQADAGDVEAVKAAVAQTASELGGLDILVNNAGIAPMAPLDQFTLEDFDRIVAVNVKGLFVATQESARHMKEGGRVINIGSVNSDSMPFQGGAVYAMSKGAVASLTRGLARDLGPRGITVNNIQPGPVDTDMNPAQGPFAESLMKFLAVGRYGKAEEVAAMVAYLAGPEAAYVTGALLKIDGGWDA